MCRFPRPLHPPQRRARQVLSFALALAGLLLAACGGDGAAPSAARRTADPFPRGLVLSGSPVVCAPSSDWQAAEGVWSFRGVAEVACTIAGPPREPLILAFTPQPDSRGFSFDLEWDGTPLAASPGRTEGGADDALVVTVPAASLTPGVHVLTLSRRPEPDDRERHDNHFRALARRPAAGGSPVPLIHDAAERYAYLADLLINGVTGLDERKASGFLFAGPGRWYLELPADVATGGLHLRPENLSEEPALFKVEVVGHPERTAKVRVPPRWRGELSLDLADVGGKADPLHLAFTVEGDRGGLFLWGAPRLSPPSSVARRRSPTEPPPILLITLDTTRLDALGAYGGPPGLTPHLDRFAADATVYERAAATAPWTLPSHASMFTGLYAGRHGAGVSERRLPPGVPALAEELRRHGYHTAGFAGGRLMAHDYGVGRGFDVYHDPEGLETRGDRMTELVTAELEAVPPGPLFLFANYFDPHYTYRAPPEFGRRTGVAAAQAGLVSPEWRRVAEGDIQMWRRVTYGEVPVTDAARRWLTAVYHAEVAYMDEQIGRLFAGLKRRGLYERAWIVVVADHGELLGEDGRVSHAFRLDPELVQVPLLVKVPGQRAGSGGGRRAPDLTSVADLFPTLMAAAGVAVPAGLDGRPLGNPGDRSRVYYEEHRSRIHPIPNPHLLLAPHSFGAESLAARRLVWEGGQECARRDDGAPRYGWRLVGCEGDWPPVLSALEERLGRPEPGAVDSSGASLSDEDRDALRALGYL